MKSVEIKRIEGKTVFKAALYVGIIPAGIIVFFGLIMFLASVFTGSLKEVVLAITTLCYGIFVPITAGLGYWFISFLYNIFARRFGGIKIDISTNEEEETQLYL